MTAEELTAAAATALARAALRDDQAVVSEYGVQPVRHRVINPVTAGLVRVSGTTSDGRPWSAIGKRLVRGAADTGESGYDFSGGDEPTHWNYWRRELLAYREGVAAPGLAPGLRAPRLLGFDESSDSAQLWLEDVAGRPGRCWPGGRYADLAAALGHWQGGLAVGGEAGWRRPWLSSGWIEAFVPSAADVDPYLDPAAPVWTHPPVVRRLGPNASSVVRRVWERRHALLDATTRAEASLAHLDVWSANLVDTEPAMVLVDWALVGAAPLGTDIVNLVYDSVWMFGHPADDVAALEQAVLAGYLDGLAAAGWHGDPRAVRATYAVVVALHFALLVGGLAKLAFEPARMAAVRRNHGVDPADALDRRATIVALALRRAEEALDACG